MRITDPMIVVLSLGLVACETTETWDRRECTQEELAYVDHGIQSALAVSDEVEEALLMRWGESPSPMNDIVGVMTDARDMGRIVCGSPSTETLELRGLVFGMADPSTQSILVNTEHVSWISSETRWEETRGFAEMTEEQIAEEMSVCDFEAFTAMKEAACGYHFESTFAAKVLSHEAAHLANPGLEHEYDPEDSTRLIAPDFIVDVGNFTERAVYNNLWMQERKLLNDTFIELCASQ